MDVARMLIIYLEMNELQAVLDELESAGLIARTSTPGVYFSNQDSGDISLADVTAAVAGRANGQ